MECICWVSRDPGLFVLSPVTFGPRLSWVVLGGAKVPCWNVAPQLWCSLAQLRGGCLRYNDPISNIKHLSMVHHGPNYVEIPHVSRAVIIRGGLMRVIDVDYPIA